MSTEGSFTVLQSLATPDDALLLFLKAVRASRKVSREIGCSAALSIDTDGDHDGGGGVTSEGRHRKELLPDTEGWDEELRDELVWIPLGEEASAVDVGVHVGGGVEGHPALAWRAASKCATVRGSGTGLHLAGSCGHVAKPLGIRMWP